MPIRVTPDSHAGDLIYRRSGLVWRGSPSVPGSEFREGLRTFEAPSFHCDRSPDALQKFKPSNPSQIVTELRDDQSRVCAAGRDVSRAQVAVETEFMAPASPAGRDGICRQGKSVRGAKP